MILHTFGDSHCGHMDGVNWRTIDIPWIKIETHWIGPKTCSSFGLYKLDLLDIKKFGVANGDTVCFSFGEVDCRAHIHKYKDNYEHLVDKIVSNYFQAIAVNVVDFFGLRTMVMCVPPVARKDNETNNPDFPTLGNDEERKIYTEYMNECIKSKCKEYSYIYFDIYADYCDMEGFLNPELSDGNVHIKDGYFMKQKLISLL